MTITPLVFAPFQPALQHADLVLPPMFEIARKWPWLMLPAMPAAQGLNMAAEYALQHDYTHLINLDIDHVHPVDVVERLCAAVEEHPEIKIIGGLNFQRQDPHTPCAWKEHYGKWLLPSNWDGSIIEVDRIGFGCTMVNCEVFSEIDTPWFMYDYTNMQIGAKNKYPGPDIYFTQKARDAGYTIYCHTGITSPHIAYKLVGEKEYRNAGR